MAKRPGGGGGDRTSGAGGAGSEGGGRRRTAARRSPPRAGTPRMIAFVVVGVERPERQHELISRAVFLVDARHVVEAQQPREVGLDGRRTPRAAERLDGFYHRDVSVPRRVDAVENLSERVLLLLGEHHLGRIVVARDERPAPRKMLRVRPQSEDLGETSSTSAGRGSSIGGVGANPPRRARARARAGPEPPSTTRRRAPSRAPKPR